MGDRLREALEYFEQEWQLNDRPYLWDARRAMESRPVMAAAARRVLDARPLNWCIEHDDRVPLERSHCRSAQYIDGRICNVVSARLIIVDAAVGGGLIVDET